MDAKQLAQDTVDDFNDRSFRQKAKDLADPDIVIIDKTTGQELRGVESFVQYSEGFVTAMPDMRGETLEHTVNGNTVTTRVHGQGTFTGTLYTPQGTVPGNGNPLDIEYILEQEFNEAGKLVRFVVDYNMPDFMRQLGVG